jgi:prepilin-type N-terminal cleavage/methylation domain-containing protein
MTFPYGTARRPHLAEHPALVLQCRGYSLVELMVVLSLFAIFARIALPQLRSGRMQIVAAQRMVIANLRLARTNAISKSVHYQVAFPSNSQILVSRMLESPAGSGTWVVDVTKQQTIKMPSPATFVSGLVGTVVEFNSRGQVANRTTTLQVDAQDTYGMTKSVQVWPSGQVNEL